MRRVLHMSVAFFAALVAVSTAAPAQELEDIIARNLNAKGGVDRLNATTAVKMTGRVTGQGMQAPLKMTTYARRPNLMRRESEMGDQKVITIFDGTHLWVQRTGMPTQQVPPGPQLDAMKQQAEFDPVFTSYKQQGHKIELVGTEKSGARTLHHLRVTRKEGPVHHYYLDAETGLETKMVVAMENGQFEMRMEDYRQIDGRMVPFRLSEYVNGARMAETQIESVEFNPTLDDSLFKAASK